MAKPATVEFPGPTNRVSIARSLLAQIKEAHVALLAEMKAIDVLTMGPRPSDAAITCARWKISQASLRKRTLATRVIDYLDDRRLGESELKALRIADQQLLRHSAEHVRSWTFQGIGQDWAGYCEASRQIRKLMSLQIQREREQLYPLLEKMR